VYGGGSIWSSGKGCPGPGALSSGGPFPNLQGHQVAPGLALGWPGGPGMQGDWLAAATSILCSRPLLPPKERNLAGTSACSPPLPILPNRSLARPPTHPPTRPPTHPHTHTPHEASPVAVGPLQVDARLFWEDGRQVVIGLVVSHQVPLLPGRGHAQGTRGREKASCECHSASKHARRRACLHTHTLPSLPLPLQLMPGAHHGSKQQCACGWVPVPAGGIANPCMQAGG